MSKKRNSNTSFDEIKKSYLERLETMKSLDIKALFAARFKKQKEKYGLSKAQLSKLLDVSTSTIDKWLAGSAMPKTTEKMLDVCLLFNMPLRYFTGEIDISSGDAAEIDADTLESIKYLAAFLDSFGARQFDDYYYTINKLFSSKALLRSIFEYIIISNNNSVKADIQIDAGGKSEWIEAEKQIKVGGLVIDGQFLAAVALEKIKTELDRLSSDPSVYGELSVIDISSLYCADEINAIHNLPFPVE